MAYQTIGEHRGERDCHERWELIKPLLPDMGVVMDIGAAEGYFLQRIAMETNLLAVGVEKHTGRVHAQLRWLNGAGYEGKVVSCHTGISSSFISSLSTTPEWIDAVLLLSVLHWINNDDFLRDISKIAGKLFIEIPDLNDTSATGQKFMQRIRKYGNEEAYFRAITGRDVRKIGTVKAHTYPTRNLWVIDGSMTHVTKRPHIDYGKPLKGRTYVHYYNGRQHMFTRNGETIPWIHGINLATLRKLNIAFPSQEWWDAEIDKSYKEIDKSAIKGDVRIHNLIVCRDSLNWIDLNHHPHRTTIYEDIRGLVHEPQSI